MIWSWAPGGLLEHELVVRIAQVDIHLHLRDIHHEAVSVLIAD